MRIPAHLRLSRHGIYYFRIVVPKFVRPAFGGCSEIKSSLRTRNLKVAMIEARRFALAAYASFEKAKAFMSNGKRVDPNDPSTWPDPNGNYGQFEAIIEKPTPLGIERFHMKVDPSNADDLAAAKEATLKYIEANKIVGVAPEVEAYFVAERMKIAADMAATAAARERERTEQAGSTLMPETRADPLRGRSKPRTETDRWLKPLFERFMLHKKSSSLKTERTEKSYRRKFDTFLNWFGDCHIADVAPEDISRYKDYLLGEYVADSGPKKGKVGLDATTVDNYLDPLSGLYKWARANGSFPRDMLPPTADQRMVSKKDKKARAQSGKANRLIKIEELATAFDAKRYRQENRLSHHFWPPLIALFSGVRLGEVSQLACSDICMEEGYWSISINDEDYKKLKSPAARRTIPMHPELVALGLPQFAQDVKALGLGPQLFPVLRPLADGDMGNAPGKKWGRYLEAVGLTDTAITFHSLRRTANTLLKKKKVPFDVRCQMVGHDLDHVNEFYASEFNVADLAEIIFPVFVFEGLDLTGLAYKPNEFDQAIKDGYEEALAEEDRLAKEKAQEKSE